MNNRVIDLQEQVARCNKIEHMKLIVQDVGRAPTGRNGEMWLINLAINNLPSLRSGINKALMGQIVQMEGSDYKYIVKGIELYATPDTWEHTNAGLLVEEVENE